MQQALLDANANAPIRVYAVWFKMYPGDAREGWRPALLPDPRVSHLWDDRRSVGRLYSRLLPRMIGRRAPESKEMAGGVLWDAYLLYGPDARWDGEPPDVVSWGATILLTRDTLFRDLHQTLAVRQ